MGMQPKVLQPKLNTTIQAKVLQPKLLHVISEFVVEKSREANVQEIKKVQKVTKAKHPKVLQQNIFPVKTFTEKKKAENDDLVDASDTKFLSKVQKKALIENKEAKNDDHIDDSDAKILPIIYQQAVKKNGEVKTILELAENKKAENADSDVKKNEAVKTILELAE